MSKQVEEDKYLRNKSSSVVNWSGSAVVVKLQNKKECKTGRVCTISKNVEVTQSSL
jgi:hypothetical protein